MPAPAVLVSTSHSAREESRREWQVTAPYLAPQSHERRPWGMHHVKLEGSLVTACGESAVAWPVFWGRDFDATEKGACPRCAQVLRIARNLGQLVSA